MIFTLCQINRAAHPAGAPFANTTLFDARHKPSNPACQGDSVQEDKAGVTEEALPASSLWQCKFACRRHSMASRNHKLPSYRRKRLDANRIQNESSRN